MYVENRTKIANSPLPVYLTPPMKGFPVEFGIGVRSPKCLNDGPTRWSKKFSHRFSRFDTIPAVTESHPASQPPSHVAVAITLNAKASSLKMLLESRIIGIPVACRKLWTLVHVSSGYRRLSSGHFFLRHCVVLGKYSLYILN